MNTKLRNYITVLERNYKSVLEPFGVKTIGIFGSVSRGKAKPSSDVDVLVEFISPPGFLKFIALEQTLAKLLGKKVDLTTKRALKSYAKKTVLNDIVYVPKKH